MEQELTHREYAQLLNILKDCEELEVFEIDGHVFEENRVEMIKKYVKANPSDKFIIWAQKNGYKQMERHLK